MFCRKVELHGKSTLRQKQKDFTTELYQLHIQLYDC